MSSSILDLREWISMVDSLNELKRIDGAHWDLEIGAIGSLNVKRKDCYALLFDKIKDYPAGRRLLSCSVSTPNRVAVTMGLPTGCTDLELLKIMREKLFEWKANVAKYPPEFVKTGPVMENVDSGKDVDMWKFPTPRWHELDGGRYIGTAHSVITRDPDTGEINLGTYRVMVQDDKTTALHISPGKHGRLHYEKWHARGEACPVAVSVGHHPLFYCASCVEVPVGAEYGFMGAVIGEPVKVIKEEITGLPIPADSEVVFVGHVPPGKTRPEGPFGEWTGYYGAEGMRPQTPIIEVERVYHRNDPILIGTTEDRPPSDATYYRTLMTSSMLYNELVQASVPDVKGVWISQEAGGQTLIIVSIKQRYAGHAKQAALLCSQLRIGAYMGKYVVVVDDDIDPTDTAQVIWAVTTRSEPEKDIDILRRCWSGPLDPAIRKPTNAYFNSRAIIDATKPFEWIDEYPMDIRLSPELEKKIREKWDWVLK
ncbi:MAG: UbiD family decarboxylase [Pseudomonadota bacterium]